MQRLSTKFALTAAIAALVWTVPVSLQVGSSGSTDATGSKTALIGITIDSAQARPAHAALASKASGRRGKSGVRTHSASEDARERADATRPEAGSSARGGAGINRSAAGRDGQRAAINGQGINGRAIDGKTANVKAANVKATNVKATNIDATNVNATNIRAANGVYVRPPYVAPRAAVVAAGTTAAVGTTVATLPTTSCTAVVYNNVTYQHCGDVYYLATDNGWVVVNPPL